MHSAQNTPGLLRTFLLTLIALIAFAANSVICRMALEDGSIAPGLFTLIRLSSGALVLFLLVIMSRDTSSQSSKGSWLSAFFLFLYAAAFSYAYISLEAGTGSLIAFGTVQITMIGYSLIQGYKVSSWEWAGILLSITGFIVLMLPGAKTPSTTGFILMLVSGFGWGMYSIRGNNISNPLQETAYNFLRAIPFLILLLFFIVKEDQASKQGIMLALLSGILTSGIGYTIWYAALKGLNSIQASIVQLFVPVLAVIGGVILLQEKVNLHLIIASSLILGGIFLVIRYKYSKTK